MPAASGFEPLDAEPTAGEIVVAVARELGQQQHAIVNLCFAGLGDPLTKLQTVCSAARGIVALAATVPPCRATVGSIRVTTNGLTSQPPLQVAQSLADSGVTAVSLSLNVSIGFGARTEDEEEEEEEEEEGLEFDRLFR